MTDVFRDKSSNLLDEQIQTLLGPKEKEISVGKGEKVSESPENTIGEIKNKYLYTIKDMSYLLLFNSFICLLKECLVTVKKSAPASSHKASQVSLEVKNRLPMQGT